MKKLTLGSILALAILLINGCASSRQTTPTTGNVQRLINRPDATLARSAAPEWCRDALKTVNSLEYQIQTLEAQENAR